MAVLREKLSKSELPTPVKIKVGEYLEKKAHRSRLDIHNDENFSELAALTVDIIGCRSELRNATDSAHDLASLRLALGNIIRESTAVLPEHITLTIEQCFLKEIASFGPEYIKIYAGWTKYIKQEAIV